MIKILMDLHELRRNYFLFDPTDYGRIFAFVDFGNVWHWAKSFWSEDNKNYLKKEIDIKKLATVIDLIKPDDKFFTMDITKNFQSYPQRIRLISNIANPSIVLIKLERLALELELKLLKK